MPSTPSTQSPHHPITPSPHHPPAPVVDHALAEEVRRLSGYTLRLHSQLESIEALLRRHRRRAVDSVAWGVFIGLWCVLAVVWLLGLAFGPLL